ncbi:MAG: CsbD family protein [Actinomycetaceae bacterium]|nr:CsbD family protein [Actinomycetaceae bacterium]
MAEGFKDKLTGAAKEAAGKLSGDNQMKAEGKVDQVSGKVKDMAEKAMDKADEAAESVKAGVDKLREELK